MKVFEVFVEEKPYEGNRDMEYVIVRTYSAGVHCGELESREGREVTLRNARRIWRWHGAWTLNEIAGGTIDTEKSKVSAPVDKIVLLEAVEIVTVSEAGKAALGLCGWSEDEES